MVPVTFVRAQKTCQSHVPFALLSISKNLLVTSVYPIFSLHKDELEPTRDVL